MRKHTDYHEYKLSKLQDFKFAKGYLEDAAEEYEADGNFDALLLAIRDVAEAQGGLSKLAKKSKLNRPNLYKALSHNGNPSICTISAILFSLGFRLSIKPL